MTSPRMLAFVDDELMRAPLTMDMALQSAIEALQRGAASLGPGERKVVSDLLLAVSSQRPRLVERYAASLREQVQAELTRGVSRPTPNKPTIGSALSLVDDEVVAVDVVLSHAIEAIRSVAEHELREMLAFTSALVGDMDVGADHNPFRAETQARALWAAAQAMPLSGGHQVAFMRHAALPMAHTLRKSFAAACTRLENEGVEPAAYRTVIPPAGARTRRVLDMSITQPIAPITGPHHNTRSLTGRLTSDATVRGGGGGGEPQLIDMLGRLFGAMLSDRRLPAELHSHLSRLQAFVVKAALEDPTLVERQEHAIWRFIDLLAHLGSVQPGPNGEVRARLLHFTTKLLDQLGEEPRHTESLYGWAIERLDRFSAKLLADRVGAAQVHIATMQQLEDRLSQPDAMVSTLHGAIDVQQLDTVPAELMDSAPPATDASAQDPLGWVRELRAGQWVRLFHKGHWVNAQLIWPGERGEIWLFGDADSEHTWAIRRSALQLLRQERLADVLQVRSLLADATLALVQRRQV